MQPTELRAMFRRTWDHAITRQYQDINDGFHPFWCEMVLPALEQAASVGLADHSHAGGQLFTVIFSRLESVGLEEGDLRVSLSQDWDQEFFVALTTTTVPADSLFVNWQASLFEKEFGSIPVQGRSRPNIRPQEKTDSELDFDILELTSMPQKKETPLALPSHSTLVNAKTLPHILRKYLVLLWCYSSPGQSTPAEIARLLPRVQIDA